MHICVYVFGISYMFSISVFDTSFLYVFSCMFSYYSISLRYLNMTLYKTSVNVLFSIERYIYKFMLPDFCFILRLWVLRNCFLLRLTFWLCFQENGFMEIKKIIFSNHQYSADPHLYLCSIPGLLQPRALITPQASVCICFCYLSALAVLGPTR